MAGTAERRWGTRACRFWQCPNGKECKYRHALPPGYVLKSQMKARAASRTARPARPWRLRAAAALSCRLEPLGRPGSAAVCNSGPSACVQRPPVRLAGQRKGVQRMARVQ